MNQPAEAPTSSALVAGKYQLVTMIGRGGMGSVWEARHASLGTRFAIKFIESEYADSQEARSRFDREARAAATIQSKHAIQIYDHGVTEDGKPYIVMELLQGEPLDKRIERLGRLTLQDTARILQQVSRGLARAHERGIVHRDLKPENIFLVRTPEDDDEIAKVLDFGIAKMNDNPNGPTGVSSSTKTGAVLGTPFYMSPEQARGLRNVDHRTDVWSLGVIAYKCVTGKLPFDGESVGDLLVKICTAPIPVPSQMIQGLPASFDAWFMRALEREPERRFATVTELADALGYAAGVAPRSAQGGQPLSALPTVGANMPQPGMATPHGMGSGGMHIPTPPPQQSPFGGSQPGYGQPPSLHEPRARTPHPAGMTNAPFTSSQPVPGVPAGGKGKLIAGMLVGLLLVGGALGAVWFLKLRPVAEPDPVTAVTPPPPTASAIPTDKPAEPPPTNTVATDTPGANTNTTSTPAAELTGPAMPAKTAHKNVPIAPSKPTSTGKAAADKPNPPLPATNTAPTTTTPATATSTPKKPPKNDPGY